MTGLTGRVPAHPARWTPAILAVIAGYLERFGLPVHDPFGGTGERLGRLADELGLAFTATDIEAWPDADPRVRLGDSIDPATYPRGNFVVVTSPVYFGNRISSDYVNGPTPTTKLAGRHAYGISLGRALDGANLARLCRPAGRDAHDAAHIAVAKQWGDLALVNVDGPLRAQWSGILVAAGFHLREVREIITPRLGGGIAGADKRAGHEILIVAERP